MKRGMQLGLLGVALLGVAYFALRASPYLGEIAWLPRWLGAWADNYGVFRNVPAFAALYLLVVVCVGRRYRWLLFIVIGVFATALEVAQIWIPTRFFGWDDIGASWLGVVSGALLVQGYEWIRRANTERKQNAEG